MTTGLIHLSPQKDSTMRIDLDIVGILSCGTDVSDSTLIVWHARGENEIITLLSFLPRSTIRMMIAILLRREYSPAGKISNLSPAWRSRDPTWWQITIESTITTSSHLHLFDQIPSIWIFTNIKMDSRVFACTLLARLDRVTRLTVKIWQYPACLSICSWADLTRHYRRLRARCSP